MTSFWPIYYLSNPPSKRQKSGRRFFKFEFPDGGDRYIARQCLAHYPKLTVLDQIWLSIIEGNIIKVYFSFH
jgi:hypothetical protein